MKDKRYDFVDGLLVMKYYIDEKLGYSTNRFGDSELIHPYVDFLNEGLVKTYPLRKLIDKIERIIGYCYKLPYEPYINENDKINLMWIVGGLFSDDILDDILHVHIGNREKTKDSIDCLKLVCTALGYFISSIDENAQNLCIESKFGKDISKDIKRANYYLYHLCPTMYLDKIKGTGLVPHSKNDRFDYPDRIYLFTDSVLDKYKQVANMLYIDRKSFYDIFSGDSEEYLKYKIHGVNPKEYSLLKIDLKGLNCPIYLDGNFKQDENIQALYIMENINPKYISVEDNFTINTKTIYDQLIEF